MDRNPPQLDEYTVCEEGALLRKVKSWEEFEVFADSGVPLDRLLVPRNVDLTKADGKPTEQTPSSSVNAQPSVDSDVGQLAPKRMRVLPTVGPQFTVDRPHSLIGNIVETAEQALLKRWPALQQTIETAGRLWNYFSSSFHQFHSMRNQNISNPAVEQPRTDCAIRKLIWHDRLMLFAIVHRQDAVYLYDMDAGRWHSTYLTDRRQQNVSCVQWQPCAGKTLAAGCALGVCLWRVSAVNSDQTGGGGGGGVDEHSHSTIQQQHKPAAAALQKQKPIVTKLTKMQLVDRLLATETRMTLLECNGFSNVSCLTFSPCGRYLAAGSSTGGSIVVWDMDLQLPTILRKIAAGTIEIQFSPDGLYLLVSQQKSARNDSDGLLRIFETQSWTDTIIEYPAACLNLNWFPRANGFLFSERGKNEIHIIRLDKAFPSLSYHFEKVEKFPQKFFPMADGELSCGGVIEKIALSPTGTRLILSFQSFNPRSAGYLMVLGVKSFGPALLNREAFLEMGYIHGPLPLNASEVSTSSVDLAFAPAFQHGALLAVCWENGRISFIPFFFATDRQQSSQNILPRINTSGTGSITGQIDYRTGFLAQSITPATIGLTSRQGAMKR